MEPRSQQERNDSHSLRDCLSKELERGGKKIVNALRLSHSLSYFAVQSKTELSLKLCNSKSQSQQTWQVLVDL